MWTEGCFTCLWRSPSPDEVHTASPRRSAALGWSSSNVGWSLPGGWPGLVAKALFRRPAWAEERAGLVSGHAHDDRLRDAGLPRARDEAAAEIVEPEAVELGLSHRGSEAAAEVLPRPTGLGIGEDRSGTDAAGERLEGGGEACGEHHQPWCLGLGVLGCQGEPREEPRN